MQTACENAALANETKSIFYFTINEDLYGVEAHHVLHVAGVRQIKKIPEMPHGLKGYLDLRGKMIPVYSLHAGFIKAKSRYTKQSRVVVIRTDGAPIGLIADSIQEAAKAKHDNTSNPDGTETCRYVSGITQLKKEQTVLLFTRKR